MQVWHYRSEWEIWRWRPSTLGGPMCAADERLGGRCRSGRPGGPRWAASRFAHGHVPTLLPRPGSLRTARHFRGLSEHGWVNWSEEIRRICGAEILRRGMFPPRKYFFGVED